MEKCVTLDGVLSPPISYQRPGTHLNQSNQSERGIPPTSQMVKNFAEEMIGRAVGKNWVSILPAALKSAKDLVFA